MTDHSILKDGIGHSTRKRLGIGAPHIWTAVVNSGPCSPYQLCAFFTHTSCVQGVSTVLQGHIQKMSFCREHSEEQGKRSDEVLVRYFFLS